MANPPPIIEMARSGGDIPPAGGLVLHELSVEQILARVKKIQAVMKDVMVEGEHYGIIPGVKKKSLFKAGSELLTMVFGLAPTYEYVEQVDGDHRTYVVRTRLWQKGTGVQAGEGLGSCSTKESKYAYRKATRTCPECSNEAIIKGKAEFGGGWVCWLQKDGCGAKFLDEDPRILDQELGRKANEDLADSYNTALKMACKRSLAAATLTATGASNVFTQDQDDRGRQPHEDLAQRVEDPREYYERIAAAPDPKALQQVGLDLAEAELDQRDRLELREAYRKKKLKLDAAAGSGQREVMDRIGARNGQ